MRTEEGVHFTVQYIAIKGTRPGKSVKIKITTNVPRATYGVITDFNPTWIASLRLAFAMSLNDRLGKDSLLEDIPDEIIRCIVEKISQSVSAQLVSEIDFHGEEEAQHAGGGDRLVKKVVVKRKQQKNKNLKREERKH